MTVMLVLVPYTLDPKPCRMAEIEARASSWSKAAALAKSAVQKEELAAGLAQLSTAGSRRDHERAQQVAGLASRLEVLEQHPAARDEVVTLVSGTADGVRRRLGVVMARTHSCTCCSCGHRTKPDGTEARRV